MFVSERRSYHGTRHSLLRCRLFPAVLDLLLLEHFTTGVSYLHTPVLYGADVFPIREIYSRSRHVKRFKNLPCPGRIVCDTSPRATRLSRELFYHENLLFEPRVLPFRAPPIFRLRVPNFYCLRGPAPPGFDVTYYCCTSFHTQPRLCFRGIFRPLLRRVFVFSCSLIRRQFAASRSLIWAQITIRQTAVFPPACCTLIWRVPCQHSSWFKSFRYIVPAVPLLVGWFEDFFAYVVILISHVASVSPALL